MSRANKQFRLNELQKIIPELEEEMKQAQKEAGAKASNVWKLKQEQVNIITALTAVKKDTTVSDHALIRYLERKYGFDFDQYRNEILTPITMQAIEAGATSIKVENISFKVVNNTITTAI